MPFSILILTYNEEDNLVPCLDAIQWCDDIVIVDSYSTDNTVKIAKENNIRVYQRKFDNFAMQRNFALETVKFKHDWIFHLDADEIFTDKLRQEIKQKINNTRYDAYQVPSKMMFMERWLRYSGMYPTYQVRLGKIGQLKFKQVGHGQKEDIPLERVGKLNSPYLHYSFSKGLHEWLEKHNKYSSDEAKVAVNYRRNKKFEWHTLFSKDAYQRRTAFKKMSYQLPFRALWRFLYMYFFKFGFLDGKAGLLYCRLISLYEFMIEVKINEIETTIPSPIPKIDKSE